MSGMLNVGSFVTTEDSFSLNQLEDVSTIPENHGTVLTFNDAITDPSFSDGFVNKPLVGIESVDDVNVLATSDHNSLFTFNDNSIETSIVDGWSAKNVNDLLTGLQVTVEGLVNIDLSLRRGIEGNPGLSDSVAFAAESTGNGGFTMGIASAGDNNVILKREPTDEDFVYLQTMSKGEQAAYSIFPAGTIFRSTKGITGFSGPFPLPFGLASLSSNYFRFYSLRFNSFAYCTSAGLETVVTLFASDETTIIDGPHTIAPYGTIALDSGPDNTEFVVVATNNVYCGTSSTNTDTGATNLDPRLIPPMTNEIITYNRLNRVTAQFPDTLVRWYRRNGETGSFTVQGGTPRGIYTGDINEDVGGPNNAGSDREYIPDGWLILKSDKPISCFSGADGAGSNSTPGWPINQLSQLFPNPATVSDRERLDQSSVSICSPYEGTATVYGSDGVIITTFEITRTVPVSSTNDQLFPAAGQWNPFQTGTTDWTGGWVQTNIPSIAVFNFMDNPIHTLDNGDETLIPGVTPDEIKAEIIQDASGIYRRRDIDASGIETWNIC